jgi:O-antigen/teichoic acid export membrane protein
MAASVISLKKELSVKAEPYWDRETVRKFSKLVLIFFMMTASSCLSGLVESTIIRQRLSNVDSAGYYMATRFSEIATYLYGAMIFAFFPLAAELNTNDNKAHIKFVLKSAIANILFCLIITLVFCFIGQQILHLLPHADLYATYWWAIPWLIMVTGITSLHGFYTTAEIAANRFGFLKWAIPLDLTYPVILLLITGHGYFIGTIPSSWTNFLQIHNIYSLSTMLWWMTAISIIKSLICLIVLITKKRST